MYLHTGSRLIAEASSEPNPTCSVCRSRSATAHVNFETTTLKDLITNAILLPVEEGGAGMDSEEVSILDGSKLIYDIDFDDMADKPLKEIGLKAGTILRITNDNEDEAVDLIIEPM